MHQLVNSVNIESTTNEFSNYYELLIENIGNFFNNRMHSKASRAAVTSVIEFSGCVERSRNS